MGEPRPFRGALVPLTHPLVFPEGRWHLVGHWPEPGLEGCRFSLLHALLEFLFLFVLLCFFGFLDFCPYINVHFYFCNLSFIIFPFFSFYALLFPLFEQRPIKREELNNSKMSCYNINLLCCWEWWKDGFLESYCLLESKLCHFLCNCGASYSSSKLIFLCPPHQSIKWDIV